MSQSIQIALVIACYFLLLLIVSHFVSRGADNSTFFSGNRRMPWVLVAIAMICAPISGVTFISVPGMVATKGYTYLQMCLGFIVGYFVIAIVLLPVYYKHKVVSVYGFLQQRFGSTTYKTGAWLFFVSKILGTSVRFFVICTVLQILVFDEINIPFPITVIFTLLLIWLYTVKGGVKAVIWTDMLKCTCLILSVVLCITFLASSLGTGWSELPDIIKAHSSAHIFNFDNPADETYFWKQFIAGIFLVVAMTGMDQDMMQHALSCKDARSSMKNMIVSGFMQFFVIALFLFLGTLLLIYATHYQIELPTKTDNIFARIAFDKNLSPIVGIFFILGLVASTYSSVGSAMTSLTTSYIIDISEAHKKMTLDNLAQQRKRIHASVAAAIGIVIIAFYYFSRQDAISAVFTLASYTYGPILGLFTFGLFCSRRISERFIPLLCIIAPFICLGLQWVVREYLDYTIGFELLIINAAITLAALMVASLFTVQQESEIDIA